MKVENIKDLKKLIDTCRKLGVDKIEVDGIKLELGAEPYKEPRKSKQLSVQETVEAAIQTDGMTEEDMLFWSASQSEQQ